MSEERKDARISAMEERMDKKVEDRVTRVITRLVTILIQVVVTFVIALVVLKFVWGWVVTDLFPGAVSQGLISGSLSWLAALKLAVLATILTGLGPTLGDAFEARK